MSSGGRRKKPERLCVASQNVDVCDLSGERKRLDDVYLDKVRRDYEAVTLFMCCLFTGSSAAALNWSTLRNCSNTVSSCVLLGIRLLSSLLVYCSSHLEALNNNLFFPCLEFLKKLEDVL